MTALEYANTHENVIIRYAGNGCPAGMDIAWFSETELPFNLEDVEGEMENGQFTATNLSDKGGQGQCIPLHSPVWRFNDSNSNLIYGIWLREDADEWQKQYNELYRE